MPVPDERTRGRRTDACVFRLGVLLAPGLQLTTCLAVGMRSGAESTHRCLSHARTHRPLTGLNALSSALFSSQIPPSVSLSELPPLMLSLPVLSSTRG